jgi:DNA polymerase IV
MHVDMDAFYAAVEQADDPKLKGQPVIVGGAARGVVSTASYEARRHGVRSAMPIFQARKLCPAGIFLPVRMARYKEVSRRIMEILQDQSPLVEQVSIDEAFVDITGTESLHGSTADQCRNVKRAIHCETTLTCSVGVAPNKFLAKIASEMTKPDGLTILEEDGVAGFLRELPIHRIPGIGVKTSKVFKELGVTVAADILRFPLSFWVKRLGKYGLKVYEKAQGIDLSPVVPSAEPKSISAEDTFRQDTDDVNELEKWLMVQSESVGRELRKDGYRGRTVTLKVKLSDFTTHTRSRTLHEPTACTETIFRMAAELLRELKMTKKLRLIGVGVSNLTGLVRQASLFEDASCRRKESLDKAMDEIHAKFGEKALKRGRVFKFDT